MDTDYNVVINSGEGGLAEVEEGMRWEHGWRFDLG